MIDISLHVSFQDGKYARNSIGTSICICTRTITKYFVNSGVTSYLFFSFLFRPLPIWSPGEKRLRCNLSIGSSVPYKALDRNRTPVRPNAQTRRPHTASSVLVLIPATHCPPSDRDVTRRRILTIPYNMPRPSSSSSSSSGDDDVRPATTRQKKTNESQHQSPITASRQQKQKTVDPSSSASSPSSSGWFKIPAPLARLFNRFPLLTYPPNELPVRSPTQRNLPALYVFISEEDALRGLPSFNPSCLKWQVHTHATYSFYRCVTC